MENKKIKRSEVVDKFADVRELTEEEKEAFISNQKKKEPINRFFLTLTVLCFWNLAFWGFGLCLFLLTKDIKSMTVHVSLIMIAISLPAGLLFSKGISKIRRLEKKIRKGTVYTTDCFVYGRQYEGTKLVKGRKKECYTINITDNNYILDEDIPVSRSVYDQLRPTIYIFDKTGKYYFIVEDKKSVERSKKSGA